MFGRGVWRTAMTDVPPRIVLATPSPTNAPPRLILPAPSGSSFVTPVLRGPKGDKGDKGDAGSGGSGAAPTAVFGEVPLRVGAMVTLTLANAFQAGSTCVYRNGLRERLGFGYTESSPTITLTTAPLTSDVISVDYLIA
jgi:hypothetical protein